MKIIAKIYTDFKEKFGIPRQSGIAGDTVGKIVFEPEYRVAEALRGIATTHIRSVIYLLYIWTFMGGWEKYLNLESSVPERIGLIIVT